MTHRTRSLSLSLLITAFLVGCTHQTSANPLTVAREADELADTLSNLIINDEAILKEPGKRRYIEQKLEEAKQKSDDARSIMDDGMQGGIIGIKESVGGYGLFLGNTLYLSSDFYSDPGPSLHIYLTTAVDPRDTLFPDAEALDLGTLHSPYGAQEYRVPSTPQQSKLRTVVIYDTELQRIFGFGQLSGKPQ